MRACVLFAGAALIALWAGCSKSHTAGALSLAQAQPGALTIVPIPFGEMNGREEYNASDIVPLADSRFLCRVRKTDEARRNYARLDRRQERARHR
jgi:hypothetical protein